MTNLLAFSLLLSILRTSLLSDIDDLASRAVFPSTTCEVKGQPTGHLKQFGCQRPPEGPIKEYTEALDANQFWELHVRDHIPLVYRGYLKDSPAVANWNDKYLSETYGDLDVLVEHKLEDRTSSSGRMRIADFLKNYKDQDMYVVSMFPSEMMKEVRAIPSILCGTFRNYTHESNFWMSAGGTRSVVHYDADHNIHCMLSGRKDFMLINNNITTKTNLYYKKKDPGVGSGFSFLDPDSIDMHKFKRIANVPWTYATLYPGDCIFIPSQYIHQVRGYGRTIAVTTLFTADVANNFNGDGCTEDIMKNYHSMAEIPFQWTYKKGDRTIDMGYMNVELVKNQFLDGLARVKNRKISKQFFVSWVGAHFGPFARNKTKVGNIWTEVFGFPNSCIFDEDTVEALSLEQWKTFCRAIEAPHGVVTDGSEPVFVKPGERHKWEIEHPEQDDEPYMTDAERRDKLAASHDPMLHHLSSEEKDEYIKQMKKKKEKYGQQVELDEDDDDVSWESEISWNLREIPEKYREVMEEGKIPSEFRDQFMESLSDVVKEHFKEDLEKNIIPKELLRQLQEYRVARPQNQKKIFDLSKIRPDYLKLFVEGILPDKFKPLFIRKFPQHRTDLEKGKLPMEILRVMLGSENEEDFQEDLEDLKQSLNVKDEL